MGFIVFCVLEIWVLLCFVYLKYGFKSEFSFFSVLLYYTIIYSILFYILYTILYTILSTLYYPTIDTCSMATARNCALSATSWLVCASLLGTTLRRTVRRVLLIMALSRKAKDRGKDVL